MNLVRSRKSRVIAVGAIAVSAVLVAGGFAVAKAPAQSYTGCLKAGALTKVAIGSDPASPCGSATEVTWNATGPMGKRGPRGHVGTTGRRGPAGQSPVEIATWHAQVGDGSDDPQPQTLSNTLFEAGSEVTLLSGSLSGDLSGCTSYFLGLDFSDGQWIGTFQGNGGHLNAEPVTYLDPPVTLSTDQHLRAFAQCYGPDLANIPPLTLTVTVKWVHGSPPQTTIN